MNDWGDWVVIGKSADQPGIAFQKIPNYIRPIWPSGEVPTQMHLDLKVQSIDAAVVFAKGLGATVARKNVERCTVMLEPEGHPFCFVLISN